MRHRPRALAALGLIAGAALLVSAGSPLADVRVTVAHLKSVKGLVQACLTTNPKSFPDCSDDARSHSLTVPASDPLVFDFTGVAPGRYAIALLHDENGNGKADKALGMLPKEGFGFSHDAPLRMGPPSFASAAFEVRDTTVTQSIRMRYLF